jgi:hypothetical protein
MSATCEVRLKPPFDEAQGGPEFIEGPDATDVKVRLKPDTTEDPTGAKANATPIAEGQR